MNTNPIIDTDAPPAAPAIVTRDVHDALRITVATMFGQPPNAVDEWTRADYNANDEALTATWRIWDGEDMFVLMYDSGFFAAYAEHPSGQYAESDWIGLGGALSILHGFHKASQESE